jgi:hypothetical protein
MGVKNGSLGTVERIEGSSLTVRLDGARLVGERREVQFDLKDYAHIDHGYAATIHKSQGVTVDHAHVLASDGLDRHAAYVGMSRHREGLAVHYGADDFKDRDQLVRTLSRERAKDTTLDFAERRGLSHSDQVRSEIQVPPDLAQAERALRAAPAGQAPSRFAGFKPRPAPEREEGRAAGRFADFKPRSAAPSPEDLQRQELAQGARSYARAFADMQRMRDGGLPVLPHQEVAFQRADKALQALSPEVARDLGVAVSRQPELAAGVDKPGGLAALSKAALHERAVRLDPELRADRFVEDWTALKAQRAELPGFDHLARKGVEGQMAKLAQGLARDPQVESVLAGRRQALGLSPDLAATRNLSVDLVKSLTMGRSLGLGFGR